MAPVNGPNLLGNLPPSTGTPASTASGPTANSTQPADNSLGSVGHSPTDVFQATTTPAATPTPAPTPAPAAPTPAPVAPTPAPAPTFASDGSDVPYIEQLAPVGADANWNGAEDCGPTSMAMIARFYGLGGDQTDAQLIQQLAQVGGTDPTTGTTPVGMQAMAQALGLHHAIRGPSVAKALGPNFNWSLGFIDQHLAAGHKIIAQGNWASEPTHHGDAAASHYIAVVGKDKSGNYMINDPEDPFLLKMTPAQLTKYINTDPSADGGTVLAVAK